MNTITDQARMSHRGDPHTSKDAAEKVKQTKKDALYMAILSILESGPKTPTEVLNFYPSTALEFGCSWLPLNVDLYDLRRRMTELDKDLHRIEPIQVGTHRDGSPQYMTRAGQRVMRLVAEVSS